MIKCIPWQDRRFTAVLGLLAAFFLQYVIALPAGSLAYTNSWLSVAVWAGAAVLLARITHGPLWAKACRYLGVCTVFGMLLALALVWGAQIQSGGAVDLRSAVRWLAVPVLGLAAAPVLAWLMGRLETTGGGYSGCRYARWPAVLPDTVGAAVRRLYPAPAGRLAWLFYL